MATKSLADRIKELQAKQEKINKAAEYKKQISDAKAALAKLRNKKK